MTKITKGQTAALLLTTIIEMSDHAKQMGGATNMAGIAALHKMQSSIQKNRARIVEAAQLEVKELA